MPDTKTIKLLLADVDGTLVTREKVLTDRAKKAVRALRDHGIRFAITSGRPPRGMSMLFDDLDLDTPIAGFNGGMVVDRKLKIQQALTLPVDVGKEAIALLEKRGLDVWVYAGNDWFVRDEKAPHVDRESWTVKFKPTVVQSIEEKLDGAVKIVGVSDDHDLVQSVEHDGQKAFGDRTTTARSQPYYLDITHQDANKGAVVAFLAKQLSIAPDQIATIGDQPNDVLMFKKSGFSIAMGNASDDVKKQASATTADSENEGFAKAIEEHLLGGAA